MLQVEVWPPAAPRFVSAPSDPLSAPAPADHQADSTARPSHIICEDGSAPNHRRPSHPGAPAVDAAGMPHSATPASSAQPAFVTIGTGAGVRYYDPDGLAAADRPQSADRDNEGSLLSSQQHGPRAVLGSALAASTQCDMDGRDSKQAGAEGDAAGPIAESAESTMHANEVKHEAKHEAKQQQQSSTNSSPNRAVGSDTSPDKHIGQLFSAISSSHVYWFWPVYMKFTVTFHNCGSCHVQTHVSSKCTCRQ